MVIAKFVFEKIRRVMTSKEYMQKVLFSFTVLLSILMLCICINTFDSIDKYKNNKLSIEDPELLQKVRGNAAMSIFGMFCIVMMLTYFILLIKK